MCSKVSRSTSQNFATSRKASFAVERLSVSIQKMKSIQSNRQFSFQCLWASPQVSLGPGPLLSQDTDNLWELERARDSNIPRRVGQFLIVQLSIINFGIGVVSCDGKVVCDDLVIVWDSADFSDSRTIQTFPLSPLALLSPLQIRNYRTAALYNVTWSTWSA